MIHDIKALDEMRHNTESKWLYYQNDISKTYNKRVRSQILCWWPSLKIPRHIEKTLSGYKRVRPRILSRTLNTREAYDSGYFLSLGLIQKNFSFLLMLSGRNCTILRAKVETLCEGFIVNSKQIYMCNLCLSLRGIAILKFYPQPFYYGSFII